MGLQGTRGGAHGVLEAGQSVHDWGLGRHLVGHGSRTAGDPGCIQLSMGRGCLWQGAAGGTECTGPGAGGEQGGEPGAHSAIWGMHPGAWGVECTWSGGVEHGGTRDMRGAGRGDSRNAHYGRARDVRKVGRRGAHLGGSGAHCGAHE